MILNTFKSSYDDSGSRSTDFPQYEIGESSNLYQMKKGFYSERNKAFWKPDLLTTAAEAAIRSGDIPDLTAICRDLYATFLEGQFPGNALQFLPILKRAILDNQREIRRFLDNPVTRHVLVRNHLMKVVLIHWQPGDISSVHGHAEGGCVFKVLHGSLEEKRYSPDDKKRLLSVSKIHKGGMAYIDDTMAFHAVGNPFDKPAISLHAYTPGIQ